MRICNPFCSQSKMHYLEKDSTQNSTNGLKKPRESLSNQTQKKGKTSRKSQNPT